MQVTDAAMPEHDQTEDRPEVIAPGAHHGRRWSSRVVMMAALGEGALALAGWLWAWRWSYPLHVGPVGLGLTLGLATAVGLAVLQYWVLHHAPERGPVSALRALYRDVLQPLFGGLSLGAILSISTLAGVGEELLFRGAMQPAWGWVAASVMFGLCHVGGRRTWVLGVWAGAVGLWLGFLAIATGGLLAPMVAHSVYDALALSYIRWGRPRR